MQQQDVGPGAQAALQQVADARRESREALQYARSHDLPVDTAAIGASPLSGPHAAVFSFYDAVRPYRHGAYTIWAEADICTFDVPLGERNRVQITGLGSLDNWRNRTVVYDEPEPAAGRTKAQDSGGQRVDRVWLPLNALQHIHDHLEDTLVEADLAAKMPPKETGGEPV
jgi:hypothetical protein